MSTEGFSSEISSDILGKYNNESDIAVDILGGTVATVADFAASTWNSLVPEKYEAQTEDLLANVSDEALRVYQENPDTIHAASFIGGMVVPMGLAFKGMKAARAGMKGVNFFTEAGQVAQKAKVAESFAKGAAGAAEYSQASAQLYLGTAANVIIDNAAFEATMLLTMNAHPYMEDYIKDPAKNFMVSMGIGTVLGGGIGVILDKAAIKGIKMGVEQEALGVIRQGYKEVSQIDNLSASIATRQNNVDNWQNILASTKEFSEDISLPQGPVRRLDGYTKNVLETFILKEKAALVTDFEKMASPEIATANRTSGEFYTKLFSENPSKFGGVESARFATAVEDLPEKATKIRGLSLSTLEKPMSPGVLNVEAGAIEGAATKTLLQPLAEVTSKGEYKGTTMIYSPKFDAFLLPSDLKHYGTAVDLIQDPAKLLAKVENTFHIKPRTNFSLESGRMTSSAVDADYLTTLKYYDELPLESLKGGKIKIAVDDDSMLSGVYARIQKEAQVNLDSLQDIKVNVGGKDLGATEVFNALIANKEAKLISLLDQGVPMETIHLHTNVPLETVESFALNRSAGLLGNSNAGISSYSTASEIGTYLSTNNRGIALNTNLNKIPAAQTKAALHGKNLDDMDSIIKTSMMLGSKSAIVRGIGTYLNSDVIKAQLSALRSGIDKVTNAGVGSKFAASTDFALRDLGATGAVATSIGKDVNELVNKAVRDLWEPMKGHFTAISKDAAGTVELNTAVKLRAMNSGYMEFKNGKFMVQDLNTPFIEVKDATGKVLGKQKNLVELEYQGKVFEITTPSVRNALEEMQVAGREMYEMRNSINSIYGVPPISDIGFWHPPFNPRTKVINYVWDKVENKTTLLFGKNEKELQVAKNAFISKLRPGELGSRYEVVDKSDQVLYNKLAGRHDNVFMASADASSFHSGASAPEIVSTNADVLGDLAQGYDHWVGYGVRSMLDAQMSGVMSKLDDISYLSQKSFENQPLNKIQQMIQKPKDPGMIMRNTLLGNSNLDQNIMWQKASEMANGVFEGALQTMADLADPILSKGKNILGFGKNANDADYIKLMGDLKARGIVNPFEGVDDYLAKEVYHSQQISQSPNMTPRILALSNSLSATMLLKFGELSQPYVNAISLPILTSAAMGKKLSKAYMGGVLDESAKFGVMKTMVNGIRYGGSAEGKAYVKLAEDAGLFKPIISEATEALANSRNLTPGILTSVEKLLKSKFVEFMGSPAVLLETMVRKEAFLTGAYMAKEAYPGIGKAGVMTFARDFMDQAVGNYTSHQRPVMFNGTLGVAMGLFQTYMLTAAQDMYRLVEARNWKGLAKTLLTQNTIFGSKSLPGFNYVSETIGEHFSDQNMDLTTGTYRALPKGMADIILYGLPSTLGPAISSRGESNPRLPNVFNEGINAIPSFNILKQAYEAGDRVVSAAFSADGNTGKAMLEALSMQSVSRPIARMSELLGGYSVTKKGEVIATPEDVWTVKSAFSRVFATRPLEEIKSREAIHLNTFYGSLDREAQQKVTGRLKTHIRNGDLNPALVESMGEEYMRRGTSQGWNSAINKAIAQTENPSGTTVRNYLKPNSPYGMMLNDL